MRRAHEDTLRMLGKPADWLAMLECALRANAASTLAALALLVLMFGSPSGLADAGQPLRGTALVIGQFEYENLPKLANPGNDAKRIDSLLSSLGFETSMVDNRTARRLRRDIDEFVEDADGADVALIYYSGHGVEAGGENYIIPVDTQLTRTIDEDRLIKLSGVLDDLRGRVRIAIILLDACRTSPFPTGASIIGSENSTERRISPGGLAASKGILVMDGAVADDFGEVIGFAAAPGQVALDGEPGSNSPYAAAITKHLSAEGFDFSQVMTLVAEEVYLATKGRQRPWANASLRRLLYFGANPEDTGTDEALIRGERRQLLLTIAVTPHDIRKSVEGIAGADNVPLDGLYAMVKSLGLDAVQDPEALGKNLQAGAQKLQDFMNDRQALKSSDAEIVRFAGLADEAIAEGALDAAITFYEKAVARVVELESAVSQSEADVKARRLEFADVYAKSARARELSFDYLAASEDWEKAYQQAEHWSGKDAFEYRMSQAFALRRHGDLNGDIRLLAGAIELYRKILNAIPRTSRPSDWAKAQSNLGNALQILGAREKGTAHLEQAVQAYEAALEVRTRTETPIDWARTQNNHGAALFALGTRRQDLSLLDQALAVYRDALDERSRAEHSQSWATTQNNIGGVLWSIAQMEGGTQRLEEAIEAYHSALEVTTLDAMPWDWASLQNNLGVALQALGERENGIVRWKEAVSAFRLALEVRTKDRAPHYWAATQNNLAATFQALGTRTGNMAWVEDAVSAYRAALAVQERDQAPVEWAMTQANLGDALLVLGEQKRDIAILKEAKERLKSAWQQYQSDGSQFDGYFSERLSDVDEAISDLR